MDNKKEQREEVLRVEEKLKEIDKELSNSYSVGKKLVRTKMQEKLDDLKSNLFFG